MFTRRTLRQVILHYAAQSLHSMTIGITFAFPSIFRLGIFLFLFFLLLPHLLLENRPGRKIRPEVEEKGKRVKRKFRQSGKKWISPSKDFDLIELRKFRRILRPEKATGVFTIDNVVFQHTPRPPLNLLYYNKFRAFMKWFSSEISRRLWSGESAPNLKKLNF